MHCGGKREQIARSPASPGNGGEVEASLGQLTFLVPGLGKGVEGIEV